MTTLLATLCSTTPCPNPIRKIEIPFDQAPLVAPRVTQVTLDKHWYLHSLSIAPVSSDANEKKGARDFNDLFCCCHLLPIASTVRDIPVGEA